MLQLSERDQKVLEAVILGFIHSGEPVGSRTVSRRHNFKVSPATIRNVMADLEDLGLLQQPHTSAGRVPTEKALRYYVDFIMKRDELDPRVGKMIREAYVEGPGDVEDLLKRSSRILSSASRQVGVVLWPKSALMRIRHLQFIRMRPYLIMLVLVTQSGLVHHRVLDWEEDIVQDDLDKYSRYVNELLEDVPLGEVKQRIMEEMQKEKVLFDELYMNALRISRRALEDTLEQANVFVDGQSNLFHNPEFADVKRMHRLLETFEDKSRIVRLLDMALESVGEPRIILGPETELDDFGEIGLISYPYRRGDTTLGVIGVMGPLRMEYSRIVPVVDFTAAILSSLLEGSDRI